MTFYLKKFIYVTYNVINSGPMWGGSMFQFSCPLFSIVLDLHYFEPFHYAFSNRILVGFGPKVFSEDYANYDYTWYTMYRSKMITMRELIAGR